MARLPNYYRWTYGDALPYLSGCVVELGCGAGLGIRRYLDRVDRVVAVDHNEQLLQRVRDTLPAGKVEPRRVDLRGDWAELRDLRADAAVLMDILEHFEDDVGFLRKAAGLLKPGGKLVLKVPSQPRLFSNVDRASGHARRYDAAGLEKAAAAAGLRALRIRPVNPLGALAYRFKRKYPVNFSRTFPEWQLAVINVLMPFLRCADFIPGIRGLSLIGVFERMAPPRP